MHHLRLLHSVFLTGVLLLGTGLFGQSRFPADVQSRKAGRQKAHEDAAALFAVGKDDQAENVLAAANRQKMGSPGWHLEVAGQLVQEAFLRNRQADFAGAGRIARRALQHAEQAARKANREESGTAASAHKLAAFINERMISDLRAAKASLLAAKVAVPTDADAERSLKRLERIESEAAKKDFGRGK